MPAFQTIAEAISEIGKYHPRKGFTFQDLLGNEITYTFPQIERQTARRAASLEGLGLVKGDRLGMIVAEPEDFVLTFLAALRIGIVPVPVYPPLYLASLDSYQTQAAAILGNSTVRVVVVSPKLCDLMGTLIGRVASLERVISVKDVSGEQDRPHFPEITPDDLAFLQYTSGSTTDPRGVIVTHRSLLSNINAFVEGGLRMDPERETGVTWLPLYHDMGLVGFVLAPIVWGISVVFIPTMRFVKNASVWLDTIHRHRAAISFAPNFAFALATRRARPAELAQWDLSCVKALGCGAEPIRAETLRQFGNLFSERCRLDPNTIHPSYGLAESTLAVTMKVLGQPLRTRRVETSTFENERVARQAPNSGCAVEHVCCGPALPGIELAIMDENGTRLPEQAEGEICIHGASVAAGYFGNSNAWEVVSREGWLRTGDLGYLWDHELYVTGRIKDLIILNGRNLHPQLIEWAVGEVEGVRGGHVVAFSRQGCVGEELVLVVEVRSREPDGLVTEIEEAVQSVASAKPVDIVFLKPGMLPKTSSGKLKRHQVRQNYFASRLTI